MSTTKDTKQKVKASSIEERIAHLELISEIIIDIEYELEYLLEQANEAEEGGSWRNTCIKKYNSKLWLKQRLEEIAEEA